MEHLLKLPGAEGEVARGDLIAEGLAHLAHAEGQLPAGGALDVLEVDKDALGGFGAEVDGVFCVLGNTLEGLEHQVELADVGPVVLADRKSTRLNSSHSRASRMPSSA